MPATLSFSPDVPCSTVLCFVIHELETEQSQSETQARTEALSHLRKALTWLTPRDTITPDERGD